MADGQSQLELFRDIGRCWWDLKKKKKRKWKWKFSKSCFQKHKKIQCQIVVPHKK